MNRKLLTGCLAALVAVAGFGVRFYTSAQSTADRGQQEQEVRTREITDGLNEQVESGDLQLRRPGETYPAPAASPTTVSLSGIDSPIDGWLSWAAAEPEATNVVMDTTGEHCARNQPADGFWYLAGSFGETLSRTCEVPLGRTLIVPSINTWCDVANWDDCVVANDWMNEGRAGVEYGGERVLPTFRQSPIIRFEAAPGNPLVAAGPSEQRMIGQWAVIELTTPGTHTVHITAEAEGFALDVTYTLNVV